MVWTTFTTAQMDTISRRLFMPLILLVNYSLLLFLLMFYWARRDQKRVRLMFAVGALGVACLVPFADPDDHTVGHLNDVSEACCVLTFLLQITIIGYDLNRKIKFRTVMALTYVAEVLIVVDLVVMLLSLADALHRGILPDELGQMLSNLCENVTLAFIFVFRYYFIIISRGWRDVWENRKLELCWYLLFATHEVPFMVLEDVSGLSWESIQALWHRVTLAGCLWIAARTKLRTTTVGRGTGDSVTQAPSSLQRSSATRRHNVYVVAPRKTKQQTQRSLTGAAKSQIAAINE
jgi:hypothetical protein